MKIIILIDFNMKNTDLGTALTEALEKKNNSVDSLVWRTANGEKIKLVDMTQDELQKAYNHTISMLTSTNPYAPGKLQIKKNIQDMYESCNAELFMRYILYVCQIESLKTKKDLVDLINLYRAEKHIKEDDSVTVLFNNIPNDFKDVTIDKFVRACLDSLGPINKKLISDKFIISRGIWFTDDDKKELTEYDENGNLRNRLDVVKERLFLNNVYLKIDPKGLSYEEFRSLVQLNSKQRFSSLPTTTLELLKNKILLALQNDIQWHIQKWTDISNNILRVAEFKGFEIK